MGDSVNQNIGLSARTAPNVSVGGEGESFRLSQQMWALDWSRHFPVCLPTSKLSVEEVNYQQAQDFMRKSASQVIGQQGQWFQSSAESPELKRKYFEIACDAFGFWRNREMVGLFIGNPTDWSSYYMRWLCLRPDFRKRRASTEFLEVVFDALREAGVARVECETAPSNVSGTAGLTSLRFRVAGVFLSERWGALTRFNKFLDPEAEKMFARAFCCGADVHLAAEAGADASKDLRS